MVTQNDQSSAQVVTTDGAAQIAAPVAQNPAATSQNQADESKYSKYYKMNGLDAGGNPLPEGSPEEQSATGYKKETEVQPTPVKDKQDNQQPPKHKSGYERRIDVLTSRDKQSRGEIRRLQSEIEALKNKAGEKGPKVTRDNYATDEEWEAVREEKLLQRAKSEILLETKESQLEQATANAFKETWTERVSAYYPDAQSRQAYSTLLKQASAAGLQPHQDIHDYVQSSDVGPVLLEYLLRDHNALEAINSAKPVVRASKLMQLEQGLTAYLQQQASPAAAPSRQSQGAPPARRVTNAPAPVGPVGNGGAAVPDEGDSTSAVKRYKAQRYGK